MAKSQFGRPLAECLVGPEAHDGEPQRIHGKFVVLHVFAEDIGDATKKRWIAARHPMPKGKAAEEDNDAGKDAVEDVEGSDCPDADEVEQSALYPQIRQWPMQALEDSICTAFRFLTRHKPLVKRLVMSTAKSDALAYTPQSQLRTFAAITAMPVPAATPARAFFAPGSPCAKP